MGRKFRREKERKHGRKSMKWSWGERDMGSRTRREAAMERCTVRKEGGREGGREGRTD
jgi:hypothetical protein